MSLVNGCLQFGCPGWGSKGRVMTPLPPGKLCFARKDRCVSNDSVRRVLSMIFFHDGKPKTSFGRVVGHIGSEQSCAVFRQSMAIVRYGICSAVWLCGSTAPLIRGGLNLLRQRLFHGRALQWLSPAFLINFQGCDSALYDHARPLTPAVGRLALMVTSGCRTCCKQRPQSAAPEPRLHDVRLWHARKFREFVDDARQIAGLSDDHAQWSCSEARGIVRRWANFALDPLCAQLDRGSAFLSRGCAILRATVPRRLTLRRAPDRSHRQRPHIASSRPSHSNGCDADSRGFPSAPARTLISPCATFV